MMITAVAQTLYIGERRPALIGPSRQPRPRSVFGAWQVCAEARGGALGALHFFFLSLPPPPSPLLLNAVNVGEDAWEPSPGTFSHERLTR